MHALVIEDDAVIALFIESVLVDAGYRSVDIAATATQAVALAHASPPAFITADVNLGNSCGIDAVLEIGDFCTAPVVFVTSSLTELHDRLPDATVLAKPICARQLTSVMRPPSSA